MKKYKVTLERKERQELSTIVTKRSHTSQKAMNALITLKVDRRLSVSAGRGGMR